METKQACHVSTIVLVSYKLIRAYVRHVVVVNILCRSSITTSRAYSLETLEYIRWMTEW